MTSTNIFLKDHSGIRIDGLQPKMTVIFLKDQWELRFYKNTMNQRSHYKAIFLSMRASLSIIFRIKQINTGCHNLLSVKGSIWPSYYHFKLFGS